MTDTQTIMALAEELAQEAKDFGHLSESAPRAALHAAVEAMAQELEAAKERITTMRETTDAAVNESVALQAKLEELEKQEPVAYVVSIRKGPISMTCPVKHLDTLAGMHNAPLYLAAGAAPATQDRNCKNCGLPYCNCGLAQPAQEPEPNVLLYWADKIDPFTRKEAPDHLTLGCVAKYLRETQPVAQPVNQMLVEALKEARIALQSSRIFVITREKTKHPEGVDWYDEKIDIVCAAIAAAEQAQKEGKV